MPHESTVLWDTENYIYLIWLFAVVVTVLMLFLCYLFIAKRRAREEESKNRAYSYLAIEALEAERRRVSRELHDTILPELQDQAVSDKIRTICHELMPPDFSRLSLKNSLADLTLQFTKKTGIECASYIEETLDFSPISAENQLQIFRITQEALTNVAKHSGTSKASFFAGHSARSSADNILICISDEGCGLGLEERSEGIGMKSMRQRADMLGAKLDFINEDGLMVRLEIPIGHSNG
jgi:two-component system NarL family sensor kinase